MMKWTRLSLSVAILLAGASGVSAATPRPESAPVKTASRTYVGDFVEGRESSFVGDLAEIDGHPGASVFPHAGIGPHSESTYIASAGEACAPGHSAESHRLAPGILGRMIGGNSCDSWVTVETLLWFAQDRNLPPLVTVNNTSSDTRLLAPGVEVAFGSNPFNAANDDGLDTGLAVGGRFDTGRFLNRDHTFGVGARIYGIDSQTESFSISSSGAPGETAIGIPYNDLNLSNAPILSENALIVAGNIPPNRFAGSVNAETKLEWVGSELYTRLLLTETAEARIDFLSGYTFNSLEDAVALRSTRRRTEPAPPQAPINTLDSFQTQNRFHAGHMGIESSLSKGRFRLVSQFKVHLGNMNQKVQIAGQTSGAASLDEGVFARRSNIGSYERDVFTFAPEVNLKLGMKVRRGLTATVGYSFMYWDNVVLAGDQIDRRAFTYSLTPPAGFPYPNFRFNETGFWLQGIDLGLTYNY